MKVKISFFLLLRLTSYHSKFVSHVHNWDRFDLLVMHLLNIRNIHNVQEVKGQVLGSLQYLYEFQEPFQVYLCGDSDWRQVHCINWFYWLEYLFYRNKIPFFVFHQWKKICSINVVVDVTICIRNTGVFRRKSPFSIDDEFITINY